MKKLFLVSLSVIAFVACNKKSEDKPVAFPDRVPEKLLFTPPAVGQKLTDAQTAEVAALFNNPEKMNLPPGDLIYPSDMTAAEIAKKELKLKAQDANSYKMLKEIQTSCAASKPVIESTFPKGEISANQVKQGDVFSVSANTNLTPKSSACPLTSKVSMSLKMVLEEWQINQDTTSQAATKSRVGISAGGNGKLEYIIQKPEYQRLLNSRGVIVDTNTSGLMSVVEPNNKVYASARLAGSYMSLDKQIDFTSSLEVATKGLNDGSARQRSELVATAEMKFPTFKVSLVMHTVSEANGKSVSELYVNGILQTAQQQQRLLNREFPGVGRIDHSPLLKIMKN